MALLVVGLVAAGIGTMAFLRNALIVSLDEGLVQLTSTDVAVNALIQTKRGFGYMLKAGKTA